MKHTFRAYRVEEIDGDFKRGIQLLERRDLADHEVEIQVHWSSVNYKDMLSAFGNKGVTRHYPHTPGIDAAGVVIQSRSADFKPGDRVIVIGYDLGMDTDGGFGEIIVVPDDWITRCPENLQFEQAMAYGTAGYTAAMSVAQIREHVKPSDGPILVSGATGGVGATAIKLLTAYGYQAVAITGKATSIDYLKRIGAVSCIDRQTLLKDNHKMLLKEAYAGGIDAVGGEILANILKRIQLNGCVTCCGNAASGDLPINVYPFILRGVRLIGIDAQHYPIQKRRQLWQELAALEELNQTVLFDGVQVLNLEAVDDYLIQMKAGQIQGRALLRHNVDMV